MSANVLVVEDERSVADAVGYNLKREGYDVRIVYDGGSALKAIRRAPPRRGGSGPDAA